MDNIIDKFTIIEDNDRVKGEIHIMWVSKDFVYNYKCIGCSMKIPVEQMVFTYNIDNDMQWINIRCPNCGTEYTIYQSRKNNCSKNKNYFIESFLRDYELIGSKFEDGIIRVIK